MTTPHPRRQRKPHRAPFRSKTRWAAWEQGVLSRVQNAEEVQRLILQRQREMDDDDGERDLVIETFRRRITSCGGDPDHGKYFISNQVAREWLAAATGERFEGNRSTTKLQALGIQELRMYRGRGTDGVHYRGWRWIGSKSAGSTKFQTLCEQC